MPHATEPVPGAEPVATLPPAAHAAVGDLLRSAGTVVGATVALALAETRLAYRSSLRFIVCAAGVFLLALTAWFLLCAVAVAAAHAFGLSWLWSLSLLLMLHVIAIALLLRYSRALARSIAFNLTRQQLHAIAGALNPQAPPPSPEPAERA